MGKSAEWWTGRIDRSFAMGFALAMVQVGAEVGGRPVPKDLDQADFGDVWEYVRANHPGASVSGVFEAYVTTRYAEQAARRAVAEGDLTGRTAITDDGAVRIAETFHDGWMRGRLVAGVAGTPASVEAPSWPPSAWRLATPEELAALALAEQAAEEETDAAVTT